MSEDLDRVNQMVMEQLTGGKVSYNEVKKDSTWWSNKEEERFKPSSSITPSVIPRTTTSSYYDRDKGYGYSRYGSNMGSYGVCLNKIITMSKNMPNFDERREEKMGETAVGGKKFPWVPVILLSVITIVLKVILFIVSLVLRDWKMEALLEV